MMIIMMMKITDECNDEVHIIMMIMMMIKVIADNEEN